MHPERGAKEQEMQEMEQEQDNKHSNNTTKVYATLTNAKT